MHERLERDRVRTAAALAMESRPMRRDDATMADRGARLAARADAEGFARPWT